MKNLKHIKTHHQELIKTIMEYVSKDMESYIYNVKRYKFHLSVLVTVSDKNLLEEYTKHTRLTDNIIIVKIDHCYYNMVFLPFTSMPDTYSLLKNLEFKIKGHYKYGHYVKSISESTNIENLINQSLFEIKEQLEHIT